jgi:hypothetical protein
VRRMIGKNRGASFDGTVVATATCRTNEGRIEFALAYSPDDPRVTKHPSVFRPLPAPPLRDGDGNVIDDPYVATAAARLPRIGMEVRVGDAFDAAHPAVQTAPSIFTKWNGAPPVTPLDPAT